MTTTPAPDPSVPGSPPPVDPVAAAPDDTSLGIDPALAGLLAYAFGWLSGLVVLLLEKQHRLVRFHAAQSVVLWAGATLVWFAIAALVWVPVVGWLLGIASLLLVPVWLALWVITMVKGYQLAELRLPLVADLADRLTGLRP